MGTDCGFETVPRIRTISRTCFKLKLKVYIHEKKVYCDCEPKESIRALLLGIDRLEVKIAK